jgi:cytochrome b6-f complex iron-sulfur subunit
MKHSKKSVENSKDKISRRGFFFRIWKWLAVIAGLEIAGISIAFIFTGKRKEQKANQLKVLARIEDIPPGTVFPYRIGQLYLVRLKDGGFMALSLKCTHLGCSIRWYDESQKFICPCHASEFDIRGNVNKPPAPRALDIYKVVVEDGLVKVDLGKKMKRTKFEKSQVTFA